MRESTVDKLRALAPDLIKGNYPNPCPISAQRAIAILQILEDGQWHTAKEMSQTTGIGTKYVRDILRTCQNAWGLATHHRNGWMLVKSNSVIII